MSDADMWENLARDLMGLQRLTTTEELLCEVLRQGAKALAERCPSISIALWLSGRDGKALVVCRTGLFSILDEGALRIARPMELKALERRLAESGVRAVALFPWGNAERIGGMLAAGEADVSGRALARAEPGLRLLAAHCGCAAELASSLAVLRRSRQRLEGGLSTLHEVASTITAHPGQVAGSLGAIVSIVAKSLDADLCAFLLYDERDRELVTQPGGYGLSDDEGAHYRVAADDERSSSVRVFKTGKSFRTGDAQNDPGVIAAYAKKWKCHSLIVVPLTLENRRLGVMRVGSFRKDFFAEEHVQFVELIAEEAVVLLESAMLNRKLTETNERLAEINRLKDDFISTVSHEFKTPLTSIKGFLSVMLDGGAGPVTGEQKRFLGITYAASERLSTLVSDLLDLSMLDGGGYLELEAVSLAELVEASVEGHEFQARSRSLAVSVELSPGLKPVRGDPKWLRQVIDNLLTNAMKFTAEGGKVSLKVSEGPSEQILSVADDGIGIAPEDQERIFERFYRAKNRGAVNVPGTGLGLTIVKSIVEKHGGRIWFESAPGRGTTFHVGLPATASAGRGAAPAGLRAGERDKKRERTT